jgi:hypothetical protein
VRRRCDRQAAQGVGAEAVREAQRPEAKAGFEQRPVCSVGVKHQIVAPQLQAHRVDLREPPPPRLRLLLAFAA